MRITCRVLIAAALLAIALPAAAQQPLRLEISNGTVTLHARNVPLRTILAEWSRVGGTRIVNGERIAGAPVTLDLEQVPERQAVDILLRGVSGYMLGLRAASATGAAQYDRILILATSVAPRAPAAPTAQPVGMPPAIRQPQPGFRPQFDGPPAPMPGSGFNDEVIGDGPDVDGPPISPNRPLPRRIGPNLNGVQEIAPVQPGLPDEAPEEQPERPDGVITTPGNPFGVPTGSSGRPGTIAPVPQGNQPGRVQPPE